MSPNARRASTISRNGRWSGLAGFAFTTLVGPTRVLVTIPADSARSTSRSTVGMLEPAPRDERCDAVARFGIGEQTRQDPTLGDLVERIVGRAAVAHNAKLAFDFIEAE